MLDIAAAMALNTSGVPLKLGLSSAIMSPVDDSICGIVHDGSRSHPHIVFACCGVTLDGAPTDGVAAGDSGAERRQVVARWALRSAARHELSAPPIVRASAMR